jgi:uncharacterized protein with HEPN domain
MSKTPVDLLRDLLQELDDVTDFTREGKTAFWEDVKTQKAVIHSYVVVGEICKRLPEDLRTANPQIDWRRLIQFRDFLAHNYDVIALRFVWAAVEDVPNLRALVAAMLAAQAAADGNEAE